MAALPYDINANPTYIGYRQAKAIVKDVATGRRTMALICSDPGFLQVVRDQAHPACREGAVP